MTVNAVPEAPVRLGEGDWVTLADGRDGLERRPPPTMWRVLSVFALASSMALVLVLVMGALVSRQAADREALRDARESTDLLANAVLQPILSNGLLTGDPEAIRQLDEVVRDRVLVGARVRIKLWTRQGRIVYSDEPRLIGAVYALDDEKLEAIAEGLTVTELSDLAGPENRFEHSEGQLLEVYRPIWTPSGEPLLFETYSRYSLVSARRADVWRTFAPITIGALILLQMCQLPLVWSMVRRLRSGQKERELLLRQAIEASADERRRIAGNVHDGVVQGLAGASFVIAGAVDEVEKSGLHDVADELRHAAAGIRESIRGLRSMLVEIYPPSVAVAGLATALQDLVAPLRAQGMEVAAETPTHLELPQDVEALVFRIAQESLRNVAEHSRAGRVRLALEHRGDVVVLLVEDDGVGMSLADEVERRDGHFGLQVLRDVTREAGALLQVASAPGQGTRIRVEVATS
jgi:signal transduction histidine kinase